MTVLHAELDLVEVPPAEAMLVLGYDDICAAADAVPELLAHSHPTQLEALDGRMAQLMREEHAYLDSLDRFPDGESWLLIQFSGPTQDDVDQQARGLVASHRPERGRQHCGLLRRSAARAEDAQGARSRARRHGTTAGRPRDLGGLGGLRRRRPSGSGTICAT